MNDHSAVNFDDVNAALHLEGIELPGGWSVRARNDQSTHTGSFSVSYQVSHESGRQGFLKVLDLIGVFGDLEALNEAISDYISERDLLLLCGSQRMSRVVVALDHGQVTLEGFMPPLSTVHYIIFEFADSDLNSALSDVSATDVSVRLDLLHDLATGLRQLHTWSIAHQDIKPNNALVFREKSNRATRGKIADLGRAYQNGVATSHDDVLIPGDRSFAPPEQLYGYEQKDPMIRRFGADLYQLGSLICYTFGAVTMNGLIAERLANEHHWDEFGDGYQQALPYLHEAFSGVMGELRATFPLGVSSRLVRLVERLCDPDPLKRGHPAVGHGLKAQYSLERTVAELNLLAIRARLQRDRSE